MCGPPNLGTDTDRVVRNEDVLVLSGHTGRPIARRPAAPRHEEAQRDEAGTPSGSPGLVRSRALRQRTILTFTVFDVDFFTSPLPRYLTLILWVPRLSAFVLILTLPLDLSVPLPTTFLPA